MMKIISISIIFAALMAYTSPALAGEWKKENGKDCDKGGEVRQYGRHQGGKGFDILKFTDQLKLSDAQTGTIKSIRSAYKKQKIMLEAEVEVLEVELKELHSDQNKAIDVLSKKIREIEAKNGDLRIAKLKMMRDIGSVMTPKQRKQFREIFAKMKAGNK